MRPDPQPTREVPTGKHEEDGREEDVTAPKSRDPRRRSWRDKPQERILVSGAQVQIGYVRADDERVLGGDAVQATVQLTGDTQLRDMLHEAVDSAVDALERLQAEVAER